MDKADFLIVGGSAAGTTAAEVLRNANSDARITIVTDEQHEQYSRVLLPHYVRHKVQREQVFLKTPQWYTDHKINLLKGAGATKLDVKRKVVSLEGGVEIEYGKLLISVGGDVMKLGVQGSNLENILYLRTVEDGDLIVKKTKEKAVIVGGGFIGLEFASCFKANGANEVNLLVREPYYWSMKLDSDSSKVLTTVLERGGIKVFTNEEVDYFEGAKEVGGVVTKSGKKFDCGVVGVGIGIKSNLDWLLGSGLKINKGIVTNEFLETNIPDIYAAGDCAEFYDVIFEINHILGNWANATSQGRTAGMNMAGQKSAFETASSYSINFFDGSCSFIGVTDSDYADEVISRGNVESGKMTRIFIKTIGGRLRAVGATVINNQMEVAPLTAVIKGKVDVFSNKNNLSDTSFELKNLVG